MTTSLLNLGLIDELSLGVYPVLLGGGKPLFNNIKARINLKLLESKRYSMGAVSFIYSLAQK